jgi:hypothetical protein
MYKLSESAVQVVAAGTRDTLDQFDAGLEAGLRTMADTVAGLRGSGIPASKAQQLQEKMFDTFENYRHLRRNFLKAIGHLQDIQRRSTQAETDAGCPTPWSNDFFTTAYSGKDAPAPQPSPTVPELS